MTQTDIGLPAAVTPGGILRRIAMPLVLFAAVLFGFLLISWYLLLPQMTRVTVAGEERDTLELATHVHQLRASILAFEEERSDLVTPLRGGLYGDLRSEKFGETSFSIIHGHVRDLEHTVSRGRNDVVIFTAIQYDEEQKTLLLEGDVRNVGPRSMTLLAEFVDGMKRMPFAAEVTLPRFTREEDEKIGTHSPFSFTVTLP
jgi:hypothetical protein